MSTINSVNSVNSIKNDYTNYADTVSGAVKKEASEAASTANAASTAANTGTGVVYEKSEDTDKVTVKSTNYKQDTATIEKLKAAADASTEQLRSIVEKLLLGQGKASAIASNNESMYRYLASGDFEVDEATREQAQKDVAEDGYWGVEQTSDRILDFAKALAGNDPSKANELFDAFEKGFKQATKTWGTDLPEISQKTYDAVKEKFNKWAEEANSANAASTANSANAANAAVQVEA
ncbi:MAG: hypothetical protein J6O71_02820 [Lachnospiraceae bacterium]|nr:hypothetical protein [Lachnospiraceae bacterium]